jgi:hypothetical protein
MNYKVNWGKYFSYLAIFMGMVAISIGLHEAGHYLVSRIFYGVDGYFGANSTQLFFQPDSSVGWGVGYAGGIFSGLIFVLPFFLIKSHILKAFTFTVISAQFVNGIVEGALFDFYTTIYGLVVIGIVSLAIYIIYMAFNAKYIRKELTEAIK